LTAVLAAAPRARAESSPEDRAAADALYEESASLIKAGRFKEAVEKLEASQKLDPGIGTTLRLAYCYEQIGRTASAWAAFNEAEAMARKAGDKRADEAAKHAKRIEPSLSRLRLDVAPDNQTAGVEIRRNGRVIAAAAWTSAVPIDPGQHVIEASAPGKQPWKTTITIEAKPGFTTVQLPPLAAVVPTADKPVTDAPRPFWTTQRVAGVGMAGAGVAGLVVGSVLGGLALSKAGNLKSGGQCNADLSVCNAAGLSLRQSAQTMAHGSTAALVVGGAALAAGVIVFATGGPRGPTAPAASGARLMVGPVAGAEMNGVLVRAEW
jgi:hypothetical protein